MRSAWQSGVGALLLLSGFLLVAQVRAEHDLRAGAALPSRRLEDLTVLIRRQQEADRSLRDEIAALSAKLEGYRVSEARGETLTRQMRREAAELRETLGLTAVHGPGLGVTLAASPRRLAVPQASDVAAVLNELWAGGAEAVAVNGVRVLATEGVAQRGAGLAVHGRALADPYTIVAIGDPAALEGVLLVRGAVVDGLRGVGMTVTLRRLADTTVGPYGEAPRFRVARPARGP